MEDSLVKEINEIEASKLSDTEFKRKVFKELTDNYKKLSGNYNSMKNETETINKNQEEMKNTNPEIKNTREGITSRLDEAED